MSEPLRLIRPDHAALPGYVAALERGWSADNIRGQVAADEELAAIAEDADAFLADLVDLEGASPPIKALDGTLFPRLPRMRLWMWDGEFCGSIGFRWTKDGGDLPDHVPGHIGYAVVPWKRQRGYAARALALILDEARARGLAFVDLTTEEANLPSQKVITANGGRMVGRFEKSPHHGGGESLRFRIDL